MGTSIAGQRRPLDKPLLNSEVLGKAICKGEVVLRECVLQGGCCLADARRTLRVSKETFRHERRKALDVVAPHASSGAADRASDRTHAAEQIEKGALPIKLFGNDARDIGRDP